MKSLGICRQGECGFSGIGTSITRETVKNSECRQTPPETNQDKAESEQCREVLKWEGESSNWPEALRKNELLITAP